MNENGLARLQPTVPNQSLPRSLSCQGHRGRMWMVQTARLVRDGRLIQDDLLRISSAADADHSENFIPNLEHLCLRTALLDDSREIATQRVRQTIFFDRRILTVADFEIHRIDTGCSHTHQYLTGIRKRELHMIELQSIRPTKSMNAHLANSSHGKPPHPSNSFLTPQRSDTTSVPSVTHRARSLRVPAAEPLPRTGGGCFRERLEPPSR